MEKNNNQNSINETAKEVNAAGQDMKISVSGTGDGQPARNPVGSQEKKKQSPFNIVSAPDIQARETKEVPCLVEGIITHGLNVFSGKRKDGKSWLALYLAVQVAGNGDFWGRPTEHGGVLYMALEDSEQRIQNRLDKIMGGEAAPKNLFFTFDAYGTKKSPSVAIKEHLEAYPDTKLVIIDVLPKIRGIKSDNQTEYAHDYKELGTLQSIARKYGISILAITHNRKTKDNNDWVNNICGGTGIPSAADTIMALDVKSKNDVGIDAIMKVTGRDIPEKTLKLHFNKENCKWEYVGAIYNPCV